MWSVTCDMAAKVSAYLARKKSDTENMEVAQKWAEMEDFYNRKLWHQLTLCLSEFVKSRYFKNGMLLELYQNFVSDFEHKLNPLSLMEIILVISQEIASPQDAISFMESFKEKMKNNLEAKLLCMISIGAIKLNAGLLDEVKLIIQEAGEELDTVGGVTAVHSRYYNLSSEYHKVRGDHALFFRDALRYLGCVKIDEMPAEEQAERAYSLGIAALVGEGIFNFGELLCQPVIHALAVTDNFWLVAVLQAFNEGDLNKFESLRKYWEKQPDLQLNSLKLQQKIRLLCLMELVFRRHAHQRTIDFKTIAESAQVGIKEVELLVMKALSLGLVKGTIDEVDQQVTMTWVQPRVLDMGQVTSIRDRVGDWCTEVKSTINFAKSCAPEVATAS